MRHKKVDQYSDWLEVISRKEVPLMIKIHIQIGIQAEGE